jgi:hypothetical protein
MVLLTVTATLSVPLQQMCSSTTRSGSELLLLLLFAGSTLVCTGRL